MAMTEQMLDRAALRSWQQRKVAANLERLDYLQKCMLLVLDDLTQRQREVFLLRYKYDMTVSQAARYMGLNKSTVSRTLARVERKLHTVMRYVGS